MTAAAAALMVLTAAPASVAADIYKFVDRNGTVHLADRPLGPGWKLIMRGKRKVRPPVTEEEKQARPLEDFRNEARSLLQESRERDAEDR